MLYYEIVHVRDFTFNTTTYLFKDQKANLGQISITYLTGIFTYMYLNHKKYQV